MRDATTEDYSVLTDSLGVFRIDSIAAGTYVLTVRAFLYDEFTDTVRVANDDSLSVKIALATRCQYDSSSASREIARRRPAIVENGGIAPVTLSPSDRSFEKTYGTRYVILGDGEAIPSACVASHNRVVFRFLDSRFGKDWRRLLRATVSPH